MMGKKKVSANWYVHHQNQMEWYESQEAAIDAVDLFMSGYENGIWSDKTSYFSLGHADGETVDSDLFNSHYSGRCTRSYQWIIHTLSRNRRNREFSGRNSTKAVMKF